MKKKLDWKNLGFSFKPVHSFIKSSFKNGKWNTPEVHHDYMIPLHLAASCLHYGQAAFEGLKAFEQKDGLVACFRPKENAKRLMLTATRLMMEPPPVEIFMKSLELLIKENMDYVPPYGTGASLYLRPLLIGSDPRIGLQPSENYDLYLLATPVGPYYKNGFFPVPAFVQTEYDRAAPKGVGHVKAAGNYAAGMKPSYDAKGAGYPISLFLDAKEHAYIDEFGTSNFFGITEDKRYVTPESTSILKSITNLSLQDIAKKNGFTIEKRKIAISELDQFTEIGACGTATVITPISSITYKDKLYKFGTPEKAGNVLTFLHKELTGIQLGEIEDTYGWLYNIKIS